MTPSEQPPTAEPPAAMPAQPPAGEGGEASCWLHLLCPECGAVPDGPGPCHRCGHVRGPEGVPTDPDLR